MRIMKWDPYSIGLVTEWNAKMYLIITVWEILVMWAEGTFPVFES